MAHDLGDLAALVEDADAVGIVVRAAGVDRGYLGEEGVSGAREGGVAQIARADGTDGDRRDDGTSEEVNEQDARPEAPKGTAVLFAQPSRDQGAAPTRSATNVRIAPKKKAPVLRTPAV